MAMAQTTIATTPGAYVLFIELEKALALRETSLRPGVLAPGHYAYCGSAYGPGGLRARLRRHLKRDKALRWHVDHLTASGRIFALGLAPGGRECTLVEKLIRQPGVHVPFAGFGSSDCASCLAHLLRLGNGSDPGTMARAAGLVWLDRRETSEAEYSLVE